MSTYSDQGFPTQNEIYAKQNPHQEQNTYNPHICSLYPLHHNQETCIAKLKSFHHFLNIDVSGRELLMVGFSWTIGPLVVALPLRLTRSHLVLEYLLGIIFLMSIVSRVKIDGGWIVYIPKKRKKFQNKTSKTYMHIRN